MSAFATVASGMEARRVKTRPEPGLQRSRQPGPAGRRQSDAVNAGYGFSQEDIALMWSSVPPRMPFSPQGLAAEEAGSGSEDDDE